MVNLRHVKAIDSRQCCETCVFLFLSVNIPSLMGQGSVYRKVDAMKEIQHTNKDDFWGQAQVSLPDVACVCSLNKCRMHCNINKGF